MFSLRVIALVLIATLTSCRLASQDSSSPQRVLRVVADVPIPGPAARFDYQSLDAVSGRLYIAQMNADRLVVFDTSSQKLITSLDGFANVHGVLAVPDLGRVYASVTGEHKVAVLDMKSLQIVTKIGSIRYPDGLAYAPGPKRAFVSDEHGDADVVIDVVTNTLLKKIPLGGGAGNTVYDSHSGNILVAVHDTNELVVIDPVKAEIVGRHTIAGVKEPHGIALDTANRLAFIAGAGNKTMALVDLDSFTVLGTYPVGRDPDVLSFDSALKQLYVAAESGEVWVYRETEREITEVGHFLMPHAHTVCADPKTHLVYFPLENIQGKPVLRIMQPVAEAVTDSKSR